VEYGYALSSEEHPPNALVENARLYTLPEQPVQIAVAAAKPKAAELAGRLGDAYINTSPENVTPDDLKEQLPVGPDPERYVEQVHAYEQAGVTHVYFHQIGRFWREELQPRL
jgi:hypothetical protein